MSITDAFQTKTKKRTLFAGALAAGLLTMGLSGGTVAASSYGGYGGYGGHDLHAVEANYDTSSSAYYRASETYKADTDYSESNSCAFGNFGHTYGYHGSSYGTHFSCDSDKDFSQSLYYNAEVEAAYETSESADFSLVNSRSRW